MKFEKKYTDYWKKNLIKPIDGLNIAGEFEVAHFLPFLEIEDNDNVLDLGCSFGRMFSILNNQSRNIYGIDPDKYAVSVASQNGYISTKVGDAENINFEDSFFQKIFCWAVYDVVDYYKGLCEANRVLELNGRLLITGKNINYFKDDYYAFTAEKNAYLKNFPNHFGDLNKLILNLGNLGFAIEKLFVFPKRGDFGKLVYIEMHEPIGTILGYEYLLILKKINNINEFNYIEIDQPHSSVAVSLAVENGFKSVSEYFKFLGLN
jgi:SAM-dependent methyltransferase